MTATQRSSERELPVGEPATVTEVAQRPTATGLSTRLQRFPGVLPARLRPLNRPLLLVEFVLIACCYAAYTVTRDAISGHTIAAFHRAHSILRLERALHINIELTVNHAINHVTWLIVLMNYYYASLHFVITIGVLVWVYVARPRYYRSVRAVLFATTVLALFGFYFYALAPPRLLQHNGYIDTVVVHGTWGSWGSGSVADLSNQYAAMPSLHIGWSTWCALTVFYLTRRTWVRIAAVCYPLFTLTVIIATANHFVVDAFFGLVTLMLGCVTQRLLQGRPAWHMGPELAARFDPPRVPRWRSARRQPYSAP